MARSAIPGVYREGRRSSGPVAIHPEKYKKREGKSLRVSEIFAGAIYLRRNCTDASRGASSGQG